MWHFLSEHERIVLSFTCFNVKNQEIHMPINVFLYSFHTLSICLNVVKDLLLALTRQL